MNNYTLPYATTRAPADMTAGIGGYKNLPRTSAELGRSDASGTRSASGNREMIERECQICMDLLQAAQGAAVRHIEARSRLRMAKMRFEHESIPALQRAAEEAVRERERTMAVLREHYAIHGNEAIGGSANG